MSGPPLGDGIIEDPEDARLDPFRDVRDRTRRADGGRFIVESPRVVARFLHAAADRGHAVEAIVATPSTSHLLTTLAADHDTPLLLASEEALTAASGYRFHAGALAVGRRPSRPPHLDDLIQRLPHDGSLVLGAAAGITSMDNMGGLFRSAAALGIDGLVLDGDCADPLLRRCLRISMGQVFRVHWAVVDRLRPAIDRLARECGIESVAIENVAEAALLEARPLPERCLLVIGNEGHGLDEETIAACDQVRRIGGPDDLPIDERPGGEDERSLNAHVAASIAFHEARRGRTGR